MWTENTKNGTQRPWMRFWDAKIAAASCKYLRFFLIQPLLSKGIAHCGFVCQWIVESFCLRECLSLLEKITQFWHTTPTQVYFADKYNISLSRQVTSQLPTIWRRLMKVNMKILQPAKIQPATITCKILNGIPALPPTTTLLIMISHSPFSTPTYFYVSQ